MLEIQDLCVAVEGQLILEGFSLHVKQGECHAIMGPNGAGKSTLAKVLAGDPNYIVKSGDIVFEGQSILDKEPSERSQLGIFMSFQYPVEIAGITNEEFLYAMHSQKQRVQKKKPFTKEAFSRLLTEKMVQLQIDPSFKIRGLNEGFSGGEKKRNELLQMAILDPKVSILDETDSGLDVDAIRKSAATINQFRGKRAVILITHYARLLEYIQPEYVHAMIEGKIVESGSMDLCYKLDEQGYQKLGG